MANRNQDIARFPAGSTVSLNPLNGSVRRNLFNSQLSRRPTRSDTATTTSSSATSDTAQTDGSSTTLTSGPTDARSEMLVRDRNGDYAPQIPSISSMMADAGEPEEEQQVDVLENDDHLNELLRTRTRQSNEQELLEAVRASLLRKVAALADDDWMFAGNK